MKHDTLLTRNVRRIIDEKGIKQKSVAERANMSEHQLSAMLNGRKQILSIDIPIIANALGVSPGDLFKKSATTTAEEARIA